MSYHLNQQLNKENTPQDIAMPPATPAQAQYEVHPSLAAANTTFVHQEEETPAPVETQEEQPSAQEMAAKKHSLENDVNIRTMRENWNRAERELAEARRLLEARNAPNHTVPEVADEDIDLAPDALAEGKHLSKMSRKVKELEKQLKNYQAQSSQQLSEQRIRSSFADFDKVVNDHTVEMLRTQYPDLSETIAMNPDLYKKASSAYTLIKQLGIYKEDTYAPDRERAQRNATKPKPLAAIAAHGERGTMSNGPLNDDQKKNILAKAREYANAGSY